MSNFKIQHFHDAVTGRLALTVATELLEDGQVRVAGAVVSANDNPSRELGAKIATGRLECGRERSQRKVLTMSLTTLKEMIVARTIGELFSTARRAVPPLRARRPDRKSKAKAKSAA